jgi:hypothetical protein
MLNVEMIVGQSLLQIIMILGEGCSNDDKVDYYDGRAAYIYRTIRPLIRRPVGFAILYGRETAAAVSHGLRGLDNSSGFLLGVDGLALHRDML